MIVLALNCGSSSVKFKLYSWAKRETLAEGLVERIGIGGPPNHREALKQVIGELKYKIFAVGHRVVHGGEKFKSSVLISDEVLSNPATLYSLAGTALTNIDPSTSLTNPLTLTQIALAVRNVPFDEIVFISYPVNGDPADPDKVVPNYTAADALWAALETNRPLQLTGETGQGDGVIVQTPEPTDPVEPTEAATPEATVAPEDEAIALPPAVTGQTAAQETCSNGNG